MVRLMGDMHEQDLAITLIDRLLRVDSIEPDAREALINLRTWATSLADRAADYRRRSLVGTLPSSGSLSASGTI